MASKDDSVWQLDREKQSISVEVEYRLLLCPSHGDGMERYMEKPCWVWCIPSVDFGCRASQCWTAWKNCPTMFKRAVDYTVETVMLTPYSSRLVPPKCVRSLCDESPLILLAARYCIRQAKQLLRLASARDPSSIRPSRIAPVKSPLSYSHRRPRCSSKPSRQRRWPPSSYLFRRGNLDCSQISTHHLAAAG